MQAEDLACVGELLIGSKLPAFEARALLAHQLGVARERLIARPEQRLTAAHVRAFSLLVERRQRGEPLAYLLGEKEFYGRMFGVSRAVLIPRPETELLIESALALGPLGPGSVLELGTGSGCVAISLALERDRWRVIATDVSNDAIEVAQINVDRWQADVELRHGSWFCTVSDERFDLIVSNPPYVAAGDPCLAALRFEPKLALVVGEDGLSALRAVVKTAPVHLVPGGHLALEHGSTQGRAVRDFFYQAGWHDVQTLTDLAGLERVTSARRPAV
ncbi:MAG: peptide chain release factor N(5)-glutamine methyltransferase [Pseudomonadota bacterium]|nr:peptide chain release factor N(5)-glutamine methyltransferase [Pseudomonadota bacterium]